MERVTKLSPFAQMIFFIVLGFVSTMVLSMLMNVLISFIYPELNDLGVIEQMRSFPVQYMICAYLPFQVGFFMIPGIAYLIFRHKTLNHQKRKVNVNDFIWAILLFFSLLFLLPFLTEINSFVLAKFNVLETAELNATSNMRTLALLVGPKASSEAYIFGIITIGIVVGISEEMFFRGLVQKHIAVNKNNRWLAIIISSVFFAVLHLNWYQLLPILAFGFCLAIIYEITGSLLPGILLHITNNSLNVYWLRNNNFPKILEEYNLYISIPVLLLLITLLGFYHKKLRLENILEA